MHPHSQRYWIECSIEIRWGNAADGYEQRRFDSPLVRIGESPAFEVAWNGFGEHEAVYLHATERGLFFVKISKKPQPLGEVSGWLEVGASLSFENLDVQLVSCTTGKSHDAKRRSLVDPVDSSTTHLPEFEIRHQASTRTVRRRLRRPLTFVGQSTSCRIRPIHPTIAPFHVVLYWRGRRIWVIDLGGGNLTLNDDAVSVAEFRQGDTLTVGEICMTFTGYRRFAPAAHDSPSSGIDAQEVGELSGSSSSGRGLSLGSAPLHKGSEDAAERLARIESQIELLLETIAEQSRNLTAQTQDAEQSQVLLANLSAENASLRLQIQQIATEASASRDPPHADARGIIPDTNVPGSRSPEWRAPADLVGVESPSAGEATVKNTDGAEAATVETCPVSPGAISAVERPLGALVQRQTKKTERRRRRLLMAGAIAICLALAVVVLFHEPLMRWARLQSAPF